MQEPIKKKNTSIKVSYRHTSVCRQILSSLALASSFITHNAIADHTEVPIGVSLVGDIQTELGCSNDWQPECQETELSQNGNLWQATFLVPAGNWSYKVALNDNWDENYGDNGNNASLFLLEETEITITYNHNNHDVSDNAPVIIIQPSTVTIVGDLQNELACSNDWQPECLSSQLTLDQSDLVWQGSFELPAGNWQYKTALNDDWAENYGANAQPDGANIALLSDEISTVKFFYDHKSHWVTDNKNSVIATLAGSFQQQLGCPGDWQPDCLRSWLQDVDGDGIYSFTTTALTSGSYETKVTHNESWDENYGENGAQNGSNITFNVLSDNEAVEFFYSPITHKLTIGGTKFEANLSQAKAYWLDKNTIALDVPRTSTVQLHYNWDAHLVITPAGIEGGESVNLQASGVVDGPIANKFRHLSGLSTFKINESDLIKVPAILKSQMAILALNNDGEPIQATGIQPPGVLDDLYTYDGILGLTFTDKAPTIRVWAPTAHTVKLHLFNDSSETSEVQVLTMSENADDGTWYVDGDASWKNKYYLFEIEVYARSTGNIEHNLVTDPYSISLSMDSKRSQIIDLQDKEHKPSGWDKLRKPKLHTPEDQAIYELHVRDFSVNDDKVPSELQGTFKAFTVENSRGIKHLRKLARAGLSSVHLLPSFDCATIPENPQEQLKVDDLSQFAMDSQEQQAAIEAIRGQDAFNWCYDPYHYTVPEGSYSTNADSANRINEFREMVVALNRSGLRVIMDVVYNHTSSNLQNKKSVLDKIVPDYYHRLNNLGGIEMSSCCANTATEHNMMEKLMLDSLRTWATAYKVDGFRFDLMGHHTKANILKAKNMLQSLTEEKDGVDGSSIYLYGEGWNFGEVVNNTRFEQATQQNMGNNTGIGSFNDHIRDAVRGGGPFDSGIDHVANQGFINGQYYDANDVSQASLQDLLRTTDRVRLALTGTLSNYKFVNYQGNVINSADIGGYTSDPQEAINYIAAHDNETLFDVNQYKLPLNTSADDRTRVQNLGNSIVALAQGIPFYHAGQEMLRSKSMDRNSYDAGDWFNILDFSYEDNGWGRGLPLQGDNNANWSVQKSLLANPDLGNISTKNITSSVNHMTDLMKIRQSSKLFRLETAEDIRNSLKFHNTGPEQIPGLIVMSLSDSKVARHIVIFNASTSEQSFSIAKLIGTKFKLHSVLRDSSDKVVKSSSFDSKAGKFTVPARTTAVFDNKRSSKTD